MTTFTDGYGGDVFTAKDARVNSAQGTYNYGASTTCDPASSDSKILLFFDLSSIPAGATCNSATLYLYNAATKTSDRTLTIYSILSGNSGWVEGTRSGAQALSTECCWNAKAADGAGGVTTSWAGSAGLSTSGTDYNATSIGSMTYPASAATGTEMTASLNTATVAAWFGGNTNNHGIVAWTASGSAFPAVYSSDYTTDTTKRPKLVIDYTAATGVSVEPTAVSATASTVNPTAILGNLSITPDAAGGPFTYTDGPGGDITSSDDAQMSSAWPTNNGGGHANFQFATSQRCLIRFDLQAIPAGATCTGATLYLYHSYTAEGGGTVTVSVYEISDANGDWLAGDNDISLANAGENCWNAKAADGAGGVTTAWAGSAGLGTATTDYKTPAVGSFSFNGGSDIGTEFTCALDETTVESWFGQASNNGLIMWPDSNSGHVAQSDNATSGYRPKLVVQYSYGTATASTVDPTVNIGTTGVNVTPTAISATAATVDPGVALGSINISPATISATATTADPTAALGSLSIEPTANTATAATVDPGVGYGNLSIGPATNTATGTTVDPSVACGSLSISPALSAATVTAADPIVEESGGPVNVIPTAIVAWATTAIGSVSGGEPARTGRKKGLLAPW